MTDTGTTPNAQERDPFGLPDGQPYDASIDWLVEAQGQEPPATREELLGWGVDPDAQAPVATQPLTIHLPDELWARVRQAAAEDGVTPLAWIIQAVERELDRREASR